jgi:hypothetical protein
MLSSGRADVDVAASAWLVAVVAEGAGAHTGAGALLAGGC